MQDSGEILKRRDSVWSINISMRIIKIYEAHHKQKLQEGEKMMWQGIVANIIKSHRISKQERC